MGLLKPAILRQTLKAIDERRSSTRIGRSRASAIGAHIAGR